MGTAIRQGKVCVSGLKPYPTGLVAPLENDLILVAKQAAIDCIPSSGAS